MGNAKSPNIVTKGMSGGISVQVILGKNNFSIKESLKYIYPEIKGRVKKGDKVKINGILSTRVCKIQKNKISLGFLKRNKVTIKHLEKNRYDTEQIKFPEKQFLTWKNFFH